MENKKINKPFKKFIKILSTVVLALSFMLVLIGVYQKLSGKEILPYKAIWVLTESMEDQIPARSYILIKTVDPETLEKGDIITFYSSDPSIQGNLNTHRIVEINGNEITTKGDNNRTEDGYPVYFSDVVGKYVGNLKLLTIFGRFFTTKAGLVFSLLFIALVFFIVNVTNKKRIDKEEQKNKEELMKKRIEEEVKRLEEEYKNTNNHFTN